TPQKEHEYRAGLERALRAGYEILKRGGSSLDATESAVRVLEDDPHFNAGKGSVFTSAGTNEMDAAIMDGKTLAAGAVAALKHVKNPISLARLVMEKSGHVMMDGEGAGTYANNATCAVSATGDGEYFIRASVGNNISALMEYRGMSLKDAAQVALDRVAKLGGRGGLIAIDREGSIALPFNTSGMYRGYVYPNGKFVVEIYK